MTFGDKVLEFYGKLKFSEEDIPDDIEVMVPMKDDQIKMLNEIFYRKFYNDNKERIFLIGINPGRFGGGITGIPFTDPIHLDKVLKIKNMLPKRHELSSRFIFDVVNAMGGPELFFEKCYLTAVSPLGFVFKDKNINYYDNKALVNKLGAQFGIWLKQQIEFGANTKVAFSLGRGMNYEFLRNLNTRYELFDQILALPHPRWVMQYRYPKRSHFVDLYLKQIARYS